MLDCSGMQAYIRIMYKLSSEKRARILHLLVEGNSLRATSRLADAALNSVSKLFVDAGRACADYQDRSLRNLPCKRLQLDEIWSFVYAKAMNVPSAKSAPPSAGDAWTWVAIDADTKLVPSWHIGTRDGYVAEVFVRDLASRLANRVQITTDGHRPHLQAVEGAFGADVDFAVLQKIYGPSPEGQRRYSPAECVGIQERVIECNPDPAHISTSFVERQNLTMRISKKLENHAHAIALHYMHYNFARIHKTLRITPAMAAGVADCVWDVKDIVGVLEAWERRPEYHRVTSTNHP